MTPATHLEIDLGLVETIPPGQGRTFALFGERIAVFRTRAGQLFATQAECPHKGGPLADGLVGGSTVICPLHGWKFDLSTGEPLMGGCKLKTYAVRAHDGRIKLTAATLEAATLNVL